MKKIYSVSLTPEVKEEAQYIMESRGLKLSAIIDLLLAEWVAQNREGSTE